MSDDTRQEISGETRIVDMQRDEIERLRAENQRLCDEASKWETTSMCEHEENQRLKKCEEQMAKSAQVMTQLWKSDLHRMEAERDQYKAALESKYQLKQERDEAREAAQYLWETADVQVRNCLNKWPWLEDSE